MKIGLFEAGLPNSDHDAGSAAIVELCALVQEMGHGLEYLYTGENPWGRTSDNIIYSHVPVTDNAAKLRVLQEKNIDVAIISRPGPAAQWLHSCKLANIPVIYFGHDIHHLRLALGNKFLPASKQVATRDINAMRLLEHNIWQQSAAVIYPSAQECNIVNAYCNKNHALEMPIYDLSAACEKYKNTPVNIKQEAGTKLLFVGGAHHTPNHDGVMWFASEVLPNLHIDFTLYIVGDWPEIIRTEIIKSWNANSKAKQVLEFCGVVPIESLYNMYRSTDIVIAPLRYGAGVKRKVAEALALGRPLIGTEISFEGININGLEPYILSETNGTAYANKIAEMLAGDMDKLLQELAGFSEVLLAKYSNNYRKKVLERALGLL